MAYVYVIFNVQNGKLYVGWTTNPKERWRKHKKNAHLNMRYHLYRAMIKDLNAFEFKVISEHLNEQEAMSAEKYWISYFRSNDDRFGYNMTDGGDGCVKRGTSNHMFGKRGAQHHNYGRRHSEETKHMMSVSQRERRAHIDVVGRRNQVIEVIEKGYLRGSISALALDWNVSHTQVLRFIAKHVPEYSKTKS